MRSLLPRLTLFLIPLLAGPWPSAAASGTQVHVAADGSDATGDGSAAAPWRSLTFALTQIAAPQTIVLGPGEYREGTGEQFPIRMTAGISILASGNPDDTRITGPLGTASGGPAVLVVQPSAVPGALTSLRGFELSRGTTGLQVATYSAGQSLVLTVDDVRLDRNSTRGLLATVEGGSHLDLQLRQVETVQLARGLVVRASGGLASVVAYNCRLEGLVNGIELRALGEPGASAVGAEFGNLICRGAAQWGLMSEVSAGNFVATRVRDSFFGFHAPCLGTPLPGTGAFGDLGPAAGQVFHDVARTIFYRNGGLCPPPAISYDLPSYRPGDYTLAHNLYSSGALPGGPVTADPGFVGGLGSVGEFDLHLRADAVAVDAGLPAQDVVPPTLSPYLWGDLDREFPLQNPGSVWFDPALDNGAACFPAPVDIGPDERRSHALYAHPPLQVGTTSQLRLLGPPLAAGAAHPIRAWVFAGAPPAAAVPCAAGLALPPGSFLWFAVNLAPTTGLADFPVTVPDDASLAGRRLAVQAVFVDVDALSATWSSVRVERIRR
jgi:hypothetical protein